MELHDDMKSYTQPTISNNPEFIILYCGTNDLRQNTSAVKFRQKILELTASCKSDSNDIWIFGIFPRRDKSNAKTAQVNNFLKNECGRRNICFMNSSNKSPRYHCNQSGTRLNKSGTNRLIENLLFALSKLDCWHKAQVSITADVYRKTNNSEEQLLSEKKAKETFKNSRGLRSKVLKVFSRGILM